MKASFRWDCVVHGSGKGNPVCPGPVWIDTRGGVGVGEGIVVIGLCPCFSTGV